MGTDDKDDEVAEILDNRRGRSALSSSGDSITADPDLRGLLEGADLAWAIEQKAPPLQEDPLAAMLGLVPDPDFTLDGKVLRAARKASGLTVSDVARRLSERGWKVTNRDVFAWEGGKNTPRMPALIGAIAEVVRTNPDRLRRRTGTNAEQAALAAIAASAPFVALAERWARMQGTTVALASSALQARLLVAVHRGGAPDPQMLLDSLDAMVSAVEDSGAG